MRSDEVPFDCASSELFYDLNRNIGVQDDLKEIDSNELTTAANRNKLNIHKFNQSNRKQIQISSTLKPTLATTIPSTKSPKPTKTSIESVAGITNPPRVMYRPKKPITSSFPVSTMSNTRKSG